ncbi:uncharacterized protein LOC125658810 [Ostrea edulis]|uniref:uncharacterized protein LOC125658810 n=1 Tax=Ostrea edulis TaxID=37623 RepID=UPI00209498C2|nr:uncharacterized protein LOC125658810 [Ostrea edulis]
MKMKNPSIGADSKIKRKIRFIHEIYANLSFAHDMLDSIESVSTNKNYAQNAMCLLYQANMRLQCKRIRKNRSWANFDDSGACKQNTGLVCRDESCSHKIPEIKDLCKIQEAKTVAVNTLTFLKTCVMERNDKLVLKRKCGNKQSRKCRNKRSRNKQSRKCRNKQKGQNRKSGSKRRKAKNRKRKSRKN